MAHTPGPWSVQRESDGAPYVYIRSSAALGQIATVYERPSANAPLIAAAPDLLAALVAVLERAEREYQELTDGEHGTFEAYPEAKAARAAISKAEGKL